MWPEDASRPRFQCHVRRRQLGEERLHLSPLNLTVSQTSCLFRRGFVSVEILPGEGGLWVSNPKRQVANHGSRPKGRLRIRVKSGHKTRYYVAWARLVISFTMLRLAWPAIFFWIARMLRSVEMASFSISLTMRSRVAVRPRCLPRTSAALIPAVTRSLMSDGSSSSNGQRQPSCFVLKFFREPLLLRHRDLLA